MTPNIRMNKAVQLFGWLFAVNLWFDYDGTYYKAGIGWTWKKAVEQ